MSTKSIRAQIPWLIWIYLFVIVLFAALLLLTAVFEMMLITSEFGSDKLANMSDSSQAYKRLFEISADGIKVALGALLGALSMAAKVEFDSDKPNNKIQPTQ